MSKADVASYIQLTPAVFVQIGRESLWHLGSFIGKDSKIHSIWEGDWCPPSAQIIRQVPPWLGPGSMGLAVQTLCACASCRLQQIDRDKRTSRPG